MASTATRNASNLSFGQLEQLWISNGGSPTWAPTMAAVALLESGGGYVQAVAGSSPGSSPNTSTDINGGSYGLWQINGSHDGVIGAAPSAGGPVPSSSWVQSMFNPNTNAQQARALLGNGSGIGNWTDAAAQAVIANGGTPLTASQAQEFASSHGYSVTSTGGSVSSGTAVTTSATTSGTTSGCNSSTYLINGLSFHFLNQCELKALKGGALAVGGSVLLVIAAALIIGRSGAAKKVAEATGATIIYQQIASRRGTSTRSSSGGGNPPSASELEGSPNRRGSASSRGTTRTVSADELDQQYDEANPPF